MPQQALQKGGEHVNGEERVSLDGSTEVSGQLDEVSIGTIQLKIIIRRVTPTEYPPISIRGLTQRQIPCPRFRQNHTEQGKLNQRKENQKRN